MHATITQTRRFVLGCLLAVAASGFTALTVHAECSDHTANGRDCTFTEKLAHCLGTSEQSYSECKDAGGFLWDTTVCEWGKMADDAACYAQIPLNLILV